MGRETTTVSVPYQLGDAWQNHLISRAQFCFSVTWEQQAFLRQWRLGQRHTAGASDARSVPSARGFVWLSCPPDIPSMSAICAVSPPSSRLPLLPCQCYHSSSSHINCIPLPLSKPGSESLSLLTSIPPKLPAMFVAWDSADWQVNEYFCHGGLGVDAWLRPRATMRLEGSQASVVSAVHSYTQQLAQKNKPPGDRCVHRDGSGYTLLSAKPLVLSSRRMDFLLKLGTLQL